MTRWKRGEAVIERLLAAGHLAPLGKAAADGSAVPDTTYSEASETEAQDALATASLFVETAARILPELGFFGDQP